MERRIASTSDESVRLIQSASIWLAAVCLLTAASPVLARTEVDLTSAGDAAPLDADGALSTRLDLTASPELNISLAGGWSSADPSAVDRTRQLFLRGDARVELADGRWIQTLYAGYTDKSQESHAGVDAGRMDVAKLEGSSRLSLGTLQELRLSGSHSLTLGLETRRETTDSREQLHFAHRRAERAVRSSHTETRSHAALAESRLQLGRARFELGGAFEGLSGETGRLLARAAGNYTGSSGIQVLAAVGLGFADPSRLATSLAAAAASGASLVTPGTPEHTQPLSWQLRASRGFARGKVTLGAAVSQAHAQGPLDRLGDLSAHLELASGAAQLHTRAERLESFVAFAPVSALRLELAYTLTAARLQAGDLRAEDELAVSRQALRANLTWTPRPDSSLGVTLRHVGPRDESSATAAARFGGTQGSYSACDIALRHTFGSRWRAVAQVESVVHRERPPGSAPAPPRVRGTVGLEATF